MSSPTDFVWPNQDQQLEESQEPSAQHVVTTVKNIITALLNKTDISTTTMVSQQADVTESATLAMNDQNETATEDILSTIADNISTTVKNIISTSTENITLTDTFNSNGTVFTSNNNNTVLTEAIGSNSSMSEITTQTILENATPGPTNIVTETIRSIINTTENAITSTSVYQNDSTRLYQNSHDSIGRDDSLIVYIILGVLLGLLIIIFVALFVFYKKYKKCRQSSGDYCVTQMKEISSSSSIKTTSELNDVHVKH